MIAQRPLAGRRVLVVEDDYFVASDIKHQCIALGADTVVPVGTLHAAFDALKQQDWSFVILDINLHGEKVFALADELRKQAIPFVFATAYTRDSLPPKWRPVKVLPKPIARDHLAAAASI